MGAGIPGESHTFAPAGSIPAPAIMLKHSILAAKPKSVLVDSPDVESTVYVRAMTARERMEVMKIGDDPNRIVKLASYAICDEEGNRVFGDADIESLLDIPAAALDAIVKKWMEINGIGNADDKQKNS